MSHSTNREPIGVIGTGYVGLVTAAGFAELGNDVWCIDIDEAKIEGLKQGRIPIWEPGLAELVERHRDRLHFSTDLADALEHARLLFVAVGTPPTYSGDADLSAVHAVVEAMPASDRHALVMKSTVPVGTGATIKRLFAEQGKGLLATSPAPSSSRRARRSRTSCTRTASSSATTATGPATPSSTSTRRSRRRSCAPTSRAPRWSSSPPTRSWPRRSRSSTRSPTSARRPAPTWSRSPRAWAWTTASARSSCRPASASAAPASRRTSTALKQLAGNSGYHFQLLNSVIEVNELQKRRVMAKLEKHLGSLVGKEIGAARPRLQAEHRRHARGLLARALRAAAGRRRARAGLRPGRRGGGAQADPRRRVQATSALEVGRGRRRGRARHRVAGVRRARPRRAGGARCAATC